MMQKEMMRVMSNEPIARHIYALTLEGALVAEMNEPGQFVHLRVNNQYNPVLRRPISIANIDQIHEQFTMIYRAEGLGTKLLSEKVAGEYVDVLGPLGNGFPVEASSEGETAILVGGGIGVPPLYELSQQLVAKGIKVVHVLGFQSAPDVFYEEKFMKLGETHIATVDGTYGTKGFVTDIIEQKQLSFDQMYACGPVPMLRALEENYRDRAPLYLSLEQRMGCGVGACFACVCPVEEGSTAYKKVCSDGPVFKAGEVLL
ncbi:dihydroorotate dehydrogenase electron transfer subunit [Priestia koreensis]|uniref:dihydroorotate dehydrogenase electron transfer subunit n=1 Tax=Priestia koreensis TaxID=284581 RepID=UPI003018EC72